MFYLDSKKIDCLKIYLTIKDYFFFILTENLKISLYFLQ